MDKYSSVLELARIWRGNKLNQAAFLLVSLGGAGIAGGLAAPLINAAFIYNQSEFRIPEMPIWAGLIMIAAAFCFLRSAAPRVRL